MKRKLKAKVLCHGIQLLMLQVVCHASLYDDGQELRGSVGKAASLTHRQAHTITTLGSCLAHVDMARILRPSFIRNSGPVVVNMIDTEERK